MATITSSSVVKQPVCPDPAPLADVLLPPNRLRKLIKTITWNLLAFLITCTVVWMITGSLFTGGSVGLVCRLVKLPAYWLHESIYDHYWLGRPTAG